MAVIERLLRGGDDSYFALFTRMGTDAAAAAELLERLLLEFPDSAALVDEIAGRASAADEATHVVMRSLNESFVTPIDREDIIRLAGALDEIVGSFHDAARYLVLYQVEAPMAQAEELAGIARQATRQLLTAIETMSRFEDIAVPLAEINRLENAGDQVLRHGIAALFDGRIDPMLVIRWKDIFERIEDGIDATERAAYLLQSIVIKNG